MDGWPSFRSLSLPRLLADVGLAVVSAGVHVVIATYEAVVFQFDRHREY